MLTDSERRVVIFIVLVILVGTFIRYFYPEGKKSNSEISPFPININEATVDELKLLPGIGDVYARRIMKFRERNNGFNRKTELKEIKGIGQKTFIKIKPMVIIGGKNDN